MIKDYIKGATTLVLTTTNEDISYEIYKTGQLFSVTRVSKYKVASKPKGLPCYEFGHRPLASGVPFSLCIKIIEEREEAYDMGYKEPKNPTIYMNKDVRRWRKKNGL